MTKVIKARLKHISLLSDVNNLQPAYDMLNIKYSLIGLLNNKLQIMFEFAGNKFHLLPFSIVMSLCKIYAYGTSPNGL
jgi:hypothetical protein